MKVLVLNQCTDDVRWKDMQEVQRETWIENNKEPDVEILSYYPSSSIKRGLSVQIRDKLFYGIDEKKRWAEGVDPRGERFIKALKYCLENFDFNFIARTSCTSYIVTSKLKNYVESIKPYKVYTGRRSGGLGKVTKNNKIVPSKDSKDMMLFVVGAHVLLSRDCVEVLVKNEEEYLKYNGPEDVVTGKILLDDTKYTSFELEQNKVIPLVILRKIIKGNCEKEIVENLNIDNPDLYMYKFDRFLSRCIKPLHKKITNWEKKTSQ